MRWKASSPICSLERIASTACPGYPVAEECVLRYDNEVCNGPQACARLAATACGFVVCALRRARITAACAIRISGTCWVSCSYRRLNSPPARRVSESIANCGPSWRMPRPDRADPAPLPRSALYLAQRLVVERVDSDQNYPVFPRGTLAMPNLQHPRAYAVLFASTLAFMVCFAVWMMFGVIGIPISRRSASTTPSSACSRRRRYCSAR